MLKAISPRPAAFCAVFFCLCAVAEEAAFQKVQISSMATVRWEQVAAGVWRGQVGEADPLTYSDFAARPPQLDALAAMGEATFPLPAGETRGDDWEGRVSVRVPLGATEQIYGLGLEFRGINRRGTPYHLRMDHYGNVPGRTHAPVPFYVSSAGYGVLFNSARFVSVYPGIGNRKDSPNLPVIRDRNTDPAWPARPESDAVEATAMAPGMEVLVFAGPTPLEAVRRYNLYFGGGSLPPRWGLGFWHRVPTHANAEAVAKEVADFARRGFPLDVVGLEPGWQSKAYPGTFDWDPGRFPDPTAFLAEMNTANVHVNLWENPYVSPDSSIYDALLPLSGSHMVWLGIVPDYTLPQAQKILAQHHRRSHIDLGVSGYKFDEVDGIDAWLWPDHARFPSGTSAEQMRQTYGLQVQRVLTRAFRERNTRTYGLVRGTNAAASGHPFVLYSDYYAHRGYVTALCNTGFSGLLWSPEIRDAGNEQEWVRRMQTVCFSPLAQLNAWASGTKPWSFPKVSGAIRDVMKLRMQLIPYLYTAFAEYRFEGTPPFRAMALEPGFIDPGLLEQGKLDGQKNPYAEAVRKDVDDQYMMGDCLLVAPLFAGQKGRDVVLPPGDWFDFHSGKAVGGGEVIHVTAKLSEIPLFVRDGGIIPMAPPLLNSGELTGAPLEIRHYGNKVSSTRLYDDDGQTFDHEAGDHRWYRLSAFKDGQGAWKGSMETISGDFPPSFGKKHWRFLQP
jgi:alpha-glucosidase (family GH31 glycosyl hydrolase)